MLSEVKGIPLTIAVPKISGRNNFHHYNTSTRAVVKTSFNPLNAFCVTLFYLNVLSFFVSSIRGAIILE
jgi:hypothetical protein